MSPRNSKCSAPATATGSRWWCRCEASRKRGPAMSAAALRVLVVDDEELARLRLRGLVEECPLPRASVVGEAANVSQALVWLATQQCDVLLLDVQMPGPDGTQLAASCAATSARRRSCS